MARQVGPVYYEGTMGDIVFYKVGDQYYSRFKGTYKSRRQMMRMPKYKRTLQLAQQFGKASKIAGWVYVRYLPQELRKRGVFGQFTGKATHLLKEGKGEKEVKELLIAYCEQLTVEAAMAGKEAAELTPVGAAPKGKRKKKKAVKQARYLPVPVQKRPAPKPAVCMISCLPMMIPNSLVPVAYGVSLIKHPVNDQFLAPNDH